MNLLISPGAMGFCFRSTMWMVTCRSLKKRSAARVAGEFFNPKICTLNCWFTAISDRRSAPREVQEERFQGAEFLAVTDHGAVGGERGDVALPDQLAWL